ncbi:MAG TPA: hypothetical protein VN578_09155 [Candidatus Binatia bacterium]|nr:hypothetical protein [Candidatus Binatia bacterium]
MRKMSPSQVLALWPAAPMALLSGCIRPLDELESHRLGVRWLLPGPPVMDALADRRMAIATGSHPAH